MTRDVSIAGYAEIVTERSESDEVELLLDVTARALQEAGLARREIGFTCSGSCDFLVGRPFSFVMALDAAGAWPPIAESHVEMDGAWALHEAWVHLQTGEIDSALVYAFARSSLGPLRDVLALQLDPYLVTPLWPDGDALAALQAQAARDAGVPETPFHRGLERDGAAAIVLRAGRHGPVIRGIDHRIEPASLGARELARSVSTEQAARAAGAAGADHAVLSSPYPGQEGILAAALGVAATEVIAGPMMVAGLRTIGRAARAVSAGARRAVAHATSGPCLQQNLVCVLETP